jgi:hypothetical protein
VQTQGDLKTAWVDTKHLRPHPRNARNGDIDAIAESLRVNGQYRPIVLAADGTILAGNHTYMAAMSLGWEQIAAVRVDVDPESPDALRIMLADNRTADLGNYDDGLLAQLLTDLDDATGLLGSGYTDDDLADLLTLINTPADGQTDPDDVPSAHPTRHKTKTGQTWILGDHRLHVARLIRVAQARVLQALGVRGHRPRSTKGRPSCSRRAAAQRRSSARTAAATRSRRRSATASSTPSPR